jgi:hypothetical protein
MKRENYPKNLFSKCKVNWISELYTFKKGLREWINILSEENYISSTVDITKDKLI